MLKCILSKNIKFVVMPDYRMAHRTTPLWYNRAPVHLNVGGTIYTTDQDTLTKSPNSKLSQLFRRSQLIDIDLCRKGYFINRDGNMFRHILNFLRIGKLILPEDFDEMDLLLEEATFYEIEDLSKILIERLDKKSGFESLPISNQDRRSSTLKRGGTENKKFKKRRRYGRNLRYPLSQKRIDEVKTDEYSIDVNSNSDGVEKIPEVKSEFQENGITTNRQLNFRL